MLLLVGVAATSAALWLGFLHSGPHARALALSIPRETSATVFADSQPVAAPGSAPAALRAFAKQISTRTCAGCTLELGNGGVVRARVISTSGGRHAYALFDLGDKWSDGRIVAHDVIGLGRGDTPVTSVPVMEMSDATHRVIFQIVADSGRRLHLYSPPGGLRTSALDVGIGAIVPNDGRSGVAIDVAKTASRISVYVNGVRTVVVDHLSGAQTASPRFLAAGVVHYNAPATAEALTAVHAQVSVSTAPVAPTVSVTPDAPPSNPSPPKQAAFASLQPPTVTGSSLVGAVLSADPGVWNDSSASFAYVWQRCDATGACTAIDGATRAQYTIDRADTGAYLRVKVVASTQSDSASHLSAAVGPIDPDVPANLSLPTLAGDAVVGSVLTAAPGTWDDPNASLSYEWRRCTDASNCTPIDGATASTYTVTTDDVGFPLRVRVTATNNAGSTIARSALTEVVVAPVPPVVPAPAPANTSSPTIQGEPTVGSTLTGGPGTWTDPAATFVSAWQRCDATCVTIDGATGSTYVLTADDLGKTIRVQITATNADGAAATATSASVGPVSQPTPPPAPAPAPVNLTPPAISGLPLTGETLGADTGTWSEASLTYSYAWERCDATGCAPIAGASNATYTTTADDRGQSIVVVVTAANGDGATASAMSAAVGPLRDAEAAPTNTAAPSISGDATVGASLSAGTGSWDEPDLTYAFAWLRCSPACAPIDGATGSSYVVSADDQGATLEVEITATNADGVGSTTASAPLGPITAATPIPPSVPPAPPTAPVTGGRRRSDDEPLP